MRDETAHEWGTRDGWATRQCDSEVACRGSYISGFQPLGFLFGLNLGLRPRLVYFAPLALGGNGTAVMGGRLAICLGLRRMVGGRVPGAKAPCFSVAGNALKSGPISEATATTGESVLRGCEWGTRQVSLCQPSGTVILDKSG